MITRSSLIDSDQPLGTRDANSDELVTARHSRASQAGALLGSGPPNSDAQVDDASLCAQVP